jgi:hypothetical protein
MSSHGPSVGALKPVLNKKGIVLVASTLAMLFDCGSLLGNELGFREGAIPW